MLTKTEQDKWIEKAARVAAAKATNALVDELDMLRQEIVLTKDNSIHNILGRLHDNLKHRVFDEKQEAEEA